MRESNMQRIGAGCKGETRLTPVHISTTHPTQSPLSLEAPMAPVALGPSKPWVPWSSPGGSQLWMPSTHMAIIAPLALELRPKGIFWSTLGFFIADSPVSLGFHGPSLGPSRCPLWTPPDYIIITNNQVIILIIPIII